MVFWYGGGWVEGSKKNYRFVGAALASRGLVTVIPDYRLYPEVGFPDFLRDAAMAVAPPPMIGQPTGAPPGAGSPAKPSGPDSGGPNGAGPRPGTVNQGNGSAPPNLM